jgi:serine/threonine protein kinase
MKKPKLGKLSDLVSERFRLVENLDSGGQGEVWKAEDIADNNAIIAVKLFSKSSLKRAKDEVQALTAINNHNVVRFIDADVSANTTGAIHFVAMEYAKNKSLDKYDYFRGDIALSTELFCHICEGVSAIHDAGFIHRDLKPGNILVFEHQRDLKVGDFGLCLPPEGTDRIRTPARENVGPRYFSAPEQTSNPPSPTHKSDIYSLGRIFHWMITGVYEHLPTDSYKPVSAILGIDDQLKIDSLLKSMVALAPSDRPESVQSVLDTLQKEKEKPMESEKIRLSADQHMLLRFIESDGGTTDFKSLVEHMAVLDGVERPGPFDHVVSALNRNNWRSTAKKTLNNLRQMVKYGVIFQNGDTYYLDEDDEL